MTVKDRILCAFGFHGKMEDTGTRISTTDRPGEVTAEKRVVGMILRCTICGRYKNATVY